METTKTQPITQEEPYANYVTRRQNAGDTFRAIEHKTGHWWFLIQKRETVWVKVRHCCHEKEVDKEWKERFPDG